MNTQHIELFKEIDTHIQNDERPSKFLHSLQNPCFFEYPFTVLSDLKNVPQSPKNHPEGSAWNHTLLVVDEAAKRKAKSADSRGFMWAAILHDVGKTPATSSHKGKITAYNHDKLGAPMAKDFLSRFSNDKSFISYVESLVRWHMQILYVTNSLPFADIKAMKQEAHVQDLALLSLCDRLGRTGTNFKKEEDAVRQFLKKVNEMQR